MKAQDFIKNTLKYSIPTIVSAVVGIAVIPIITRLYPAEEYGKISLFYSVGTMMASVFSLGLFSSCVRFFYEPISGTDRQEIFNFTYFVGGGLNFVAAVLTFFLFRDKASKYLFGENNAWALLLFFFYVEATIVYKMQSQYARLDHKALIFNLLQVIYIFANKVLFIIGVVYSNRYFWAILIITTSLLLEILTIGRCSLKFSMKLPHNEAKKQLLAFALPLLPAEIAVMLNNSAAKMVLSSFGDFKAIGIISMATNVANTFNIISGAFGVYWSSFMYEHYQKEHEMIRRIHNIMSYLSIVLVCGIFLFQDVLYMILGENYRESKPYFLLIMLMPVQVLLCETTSYGINISKKTYINMIISIVACIGNVAISYYLYPIMGTIAMAFGIASSALFQMIVKTIIAQRYYLSIVTKRQTAYVMTIISLICFINVYLCYVLKYRLLICLIVLGVTVAVYKDESKITLTLLNKKIRK